MPLTITPLNQTEAANFAGGTMVVTSGTISPVAGCLLVAIVYGENKVPALGTATSMTTTVTDTLTDTGGGTWTKQAECMRPLPYTNGVFADNAEIFTRVVGNTPGTSKTVTCALAFNNPGAVTVCDNLELVLEVIQVTGQAASPNGGNTGTTFRGSPGPTSYAMDVGVTPAADSAVISLLYDYYSTNIPSSPPTGFTTLYIKNPLSNGSAGHSAYKIGATSQTHTWTGLNAADGYMGAAFEIKAAPSISGTPQVLPGTQTAAPAGFDTTVVVNQPTGTQIGERLVAYVSWVGSANPTLTGPSGWTQVAATTTNNTVSSGSRVVEWVFTHIADSTDVAASTFTFTYSASSGTRRAACLRLSACVLDVAAVRMESITGGSGNYLLERVTTTGANRLILYGFTTQDGNNTVPTGTTSVVSWDGEFSKITSESQATAGITTARTTVSEGTEPIALTTTAWVSTLPVLLAAGDGTTRTGTQTNSVQATLTPLPGHTMFAFTESAPSGTTPTLTTTPIVDSLGGTWTQVVLSSPAHTFGNAAWGHRYGLYRRSTPTEGTPITVTYTPFVSQVGYSEVTLVTSPGVVDVVQSKAFANAASATSVTLTLDAAPSAANTTIASPGLNSDQTPAARQADVAGWTTIHSNISQSYVSHAIYAQQANTSAAFTQANTGGGGTGGSTGGVIAELTLTTPGGGTPALPTTIKAASFPAGATARYDRTSLGLGTGSDVTWCCWAKLRVDADYYQFALSVDNGGSTYVHMGTQGNGTTWWVDTHSGGAGAGLDQTPGTWYFLAMVWRAAGVDTVYAVASGASTVGAGSSSSWVGLSNTDTFWIGSDGFTSEWQGSIGNVKIWTAALTQAELDAEMYKVAPQRAANLFAHYSFVRGPQTNDESGNGRALTQLGATLTVDNSGPPLSVPATYTENTSFSITATVTETDVKSLAVQEGFRWRKDNGSETTATGAASQDVNVLTPLTTNLRLRTVVDTTLDKASVAYTLNYKKSTDSLYIPVTVGSATVAPTWQANGTYSLTAAAITPAFPAGIAVGDILVLFVETANQATTIANQGGGTWTEIGTQVGVGTAGSTSAARLSMWWSRYDGVQTAPTTNSAGDHQGAFIASFRGCKRTGSPINVVPTFTTEAGPSTITIPGATTTVANCLIVTAIADDYDNVSAARYSAWTNASLASITERQDIGSTTANGGGFGMATGVKVAAGAYSATTVTAATAILANSNGSFALAPEDRPIYVSPSANITAGGEVTTARLAPPAGKSGSAYIGTIGYSNIGSGAVTTEDWYGLDAHHPARSELTYTAAVGDSITELFVYGSSATSAAVEVAVYATTGGTTITTRVGLPVSISLTTTAGWRKATCSIPLTAGVTYTLAYDWYVTAPVTMYRTTGLYSSGTSRSNSSDAALGTTWTQAGTSSGESFSVYGTVSRSPVVSFTAGRMWDDENGVDPIDITANGYTELEWCLQAQSPAATSDIYTFQVYAGTTPLDTYLVTPQWTIGTALGYYDETGLSISIGSTVTCTDTYSGAGPPILFTENFTEADNTHWDFFRWPHQHPFGTIVSGLGLIPTGGSPAQIYASQYVSDFEMTFKYRWDSAIGGQYPEIAYRIMDGMGNPNGIGYVLQIDGSPGSAYIYGPSYGYVVGGTGVSSSTLHDAGNRWFKIRVVGHNHKVRWWDVGSAEPSTWQIDVTDTTPPVDVGGNVVVAGGIGVRSWGGTQFYVDDFTITDLASPPTFKPNGSLRVLPHAQVLQSAPFATNTDMTYCCWFKLHNNYSSATSVMQLYDGAASSYFITLIDPGDHKLWHLNAAGSQIDSGYVVPLDSWTFMAVTRSITGGTDLYYAPQGATTLTGPAHSATTGTVTSLNLYLLSGPNGAGYASGCAFKVWTAALTKTQLEAEMAFYSAQRSTNLFTSWPHRDGMDHRSENAPGDTTKWLNWSAGAILSGPKPTFLDLPSGGAHYVETGLSCPIVANLLSTDKQGHKEPGLSLPIAATTTSVVNTFHNREATYFHLPSLLSYNFEETGTTVTDRSGNGRSATLSPSDLHSSGQLLFNNTGQLLSYTPDAPALPQFASVTLKFTTSNNNFNEINLWSKMRVANSSNFNMFIEGAQLSAVVRGTTVVGPSIIAAGQSVTGYPLAANTTYQAALTYDGTTTRLYVNGVEVKTNTSAQGPLDMTGTDTTYSIGDTPNDTTTIFLPGEIFYVDDVRFFDYALTAAEVAYAAITSVFTGLVGLTTTSTATVTCTDQQHHREAAALPLPIVATVDITADYHAGAGANHYDETGRSVLVTAPVTSTDKQAHKEPGLSLPIVERDAVTDKRANKELALSLPIVADAATTTLAHRRDLALSLPIIASVDSTSQAHFREPVASTTITATVTLTDLRKYVDLALSVPVTVTTQSTAQGHFREVTIVYVQVPVTCTDLQQSPGHFDETGRVVLAMATATSTDRAKFREDTPLSVEVSVTVTLTDGRHYIEVSLTVPITATVEATSLIHLLEPVSLLITAAVSPTDRAHFREVLSTPVLATFTVSDHIALPGEHRTVSIVATVTMTERSSYRQLALSVPVQATVLRIDSLSALAFFPLLIAATFKASDQKSRVGVVVLNDADALYLGNERVDAVYVGSSQAWP